MDQIEVNIAPRNNTTTKVNKKDKIKLKKQELKLKQERKKIKRQKYNVYKNEIQDPQQEYQENQQTDSQEQKYKSKKQITAKLAKERIINKKIDIPEIPQKQDETDELFTKLVGTPVRIFYHMENSSSFVFNKINTDIFEKCDRILDMGFKKDVDLIIKLMEKQQPLDKYIKDISFSTHQLKHKHNKWVESQSKRI